MNDVELGKSLVGKLVVFNHKPAGVQPTRVTGCNKEGLVQIHGFTGLFNPTCFEIVEPPPAPKRELILEEWNKYYIGVYPTPLTLPQAAEMKGAFFAGATAALALLIRVMDEDDLLEDLRAEARAYAHQT